MEIRRLGNQGLEVSAIGLGTMGMTGVAGMPDMYGAVDEAEAIATIHRALDLDVTFLDTAEVYGPYANEALVGRALRGRRDRAVIATKFGFRIDADGRMQGLDGSPDNARRALDGCLERLGVETIDLWYLHRYDRAVPVEETVGAMAEGVRAGKVRYLGLSEVGVDTLRRAHAVHPISALQSEYSIWERNIESAVLATCRALGIGIVPYSPLGRGFLTGALPAPDALGESDYRRRYDPRLAPGHYERNLAIVRAIDHVASRHGATAAQVALAWLLHQGEDIVPIPGTKRRTWLEANAAAVALALMPEDLAALDAVATTSGARYGERAMQMIDR
jgi:aryl-alcohol dehydrogenase-like predicted oxidoreductase